MLGISELIQWCEGMCGQTIAPSAMCYVEWEERPWGDRLLVIVGTQTIFVRALVGEREFHEEYALCADGVASLRSALEAVPQPDVLSPSSHVLDGLSLYVLLPDVEYARKVVCWSPLQTIEDTQIRLWAGDVWEHLDPLIPDTSALRQAQCFLLQGGSLRREKLDPRAFCANGSTEKAELRIVDMPMPVHVRAAIHRAGFETMRELSQLSQDELMDRIAGGAEERKSIASVVGDALRNLGRGFRQ